MIHAICILILIICDIIVYAKHKMKSQIYGNMVLVVCLWHDTCIFEWWDEIDTGFYEIGSLRITFETIIKAKR